MNFKRTRIKTAVFAALLSFLIFLTTVQTHINGSDSRYTTDVGEIQNALPRWGTLHFSGYPQYTFLGSLFVTITRPFIEPITAAAVYSAVWGAIAIGLLAWLMMELGISKWIAGGTAVLFALSTSMWMDASIAELHTMSMALIFAILIFTVRFARDGCVRDLYWLALATSMGIVHQRFIALLGVGVLFMVAPHWRLIFSKLPQLIGIGLLSVLTYIYLPLRAWMGAEWLFSSPGTWEGFKALIMDTKVDRVVNAPTSISNMWERTRGVTGALNDDWPFPLWIVGLFGLFLAPQGWRTRIGLSLVWLVIGVATILIWVGFIGDALLALKMPITAMAAIGIAFIADRVAQQKIGRYAVAVVGVALFVWLFFNNRPPVLAVTRDKSMFETVTRVERIDETKDGRLQTLSTLWGHDYWAIAYSQTFDDKYPYLNLVTHDDDFAAILARGDHLLTMEKTFFYRPVAEWEQMIGQNLYLSSPAPAIVEMATEPLLAEDNLLLQDLGNGIGVKTAVITHPTPDTVLLDVVWQAKADDLDDYSVAVHLTTQPSPTSAQGTLIQADSSHPVNGWYPTSRWQAGELVRDQYLLHLPPGSTLRSLRFGMYQQLVDGSFKNSEWVEIE